MQGCHITFTKYHFSSAVVMVIISLKRVSYIGTNIKQIFDNAVIILRVRGQAGAFIQEV